MEGGGGGEGELGSEEKAREEKAGEEKAGEEKVREDVEDWRVSLSGLLMRLWSPVPTLGNFLEGGEEEEGEEEMETEKKAGDNVDEDPS